MSQQQPAIRIFLREYPEAGFGYDVEILSETATVGDYVAALDAFQSSTMADCRGCDGCCHERVPLTYADYFLGRGYLAQQQQTQPEAISLAAWLQAVATPQRLGEALDLVLNRQENGACQFLRIDQKECCCHPYRTLACRTHCCLPKSPRALDLRSAIINAGEDELCWQLLTLPEPPWPQLLQGACAADYQDNGFHPYTGADWQQVPLHSLVENSLWGKLTTLSTKETEESS